MYPFVATALIEIAVSIDCTCVAEWAAGWRVVHRTYRAAAEEDHKEGLAHTGDADDPAQANEENHSKDVLHRRNKDAPQRAHLAALHITHISSESG